MLDQKSIHYLSRIWQVFRIIILLALSAALLAGSIVPSAGLTNQLRALTRQVEFDFVTWTLDALGSKLKGWALSVKRFIEPEQQSQIVLETLEQVRRVNQLNAELLILYAEPNIPDHQAASRELRADLAREQARLDSLAPLAESILQTQLTSVILDAGVGFLGQVFPPPLYQASATPNNMIVSPRSEIRQAQSLSLKPGLQADHRDDLENRVFSELNHSALVVPVGGIGTYPNMVMQTTNIVWLTEVIAHEWVHNYLTLRPLGLHFFSSPKLNTINETTATIGGEELGLMLLQRYYPEHVPPEMPDVPAQISLAEPEPEPALFDFREQMRITRVVVDHLLESGEIEAAETYMEERRQFFWENGHPIRKLNQAYFAFYGAYNAAPGGGASGEDPVGPAVVAFRDRFDNLGEFLNAISWVTSFEALLERLSST